MRSAARFAAVRQGDMTGPTGQGIGPRGVGHRSAWSPFIGNPNDLPPINPDMTRPYRLLQHGSYSVGATRAVPFSKATELNSEAAKLSASVGEWATKKVGAFASDESASAIASRFPVASDGEFFLLFRQWKADWDQFYAWRRDNPPPWYSPIPSDGMTEAYGDLPAYDALFARYEALLARAKAIGVLTTAAVPSQDSLAEEALGDAAKGAGEGLGKALSNLGEIGTYIVFGAIAVGGAYLLGPIVWKAARR